MRAEGEKIKRPDVRASVRPSANMPDTICEQLEDQFLRQTTGSPRGIRLSAPSPTTYNDLDDESSSTRHRFAIPALEDAPNLYRRTALYVDYKGCKVCLQLILFFVCQWRCGVSALRKVEKRLLPVPISDVVIVAVHKGVME